MTILSSPFFVGVEIGVGFFLKLIKNLGINPDTELLGFDFTELRSLLKSILYMVRALLQSFQ